jgi:uncharacterized iron-regulated membrane protein
MKLRHIIFNLHLYIGLAAGLFLLLSGLTGSISVFRDEIEALTHPEFTEIAVGEERVPLQAVLDAVKHAYPQDKLLHLRMPRTPQETYVLRMNSAHDLFVYVNPYNGEVLGGHRQRDTFMGWIALLHTELLSGERGKNILGVSALLLICMCGTGLFLWWPSNGIKNIYRGLKISWKAPWKRIFFDIHRAFGAYTVIFLIIVAFTGVSLVFNKAVAELINSLTASAPRPSPPNSRMGEAPVSIPSLDALLNHADRILSAPTTWITFPQTPQAPLVVRKRMPDEFNPNGRSFIYFDRYTGEALFVENASNAPLGTRIFNTFYPIHTGAIGGLPTRLLQVAAGLAPLFLFATGYMMWRNRRKAKSHKNNPKVAYKSHPDRA